jgi:hypothetical protein
MTTSEDDSATYHRDLLRIFRHGRDTLRKSWETLSTSSEPQETGREKGRVGGGVGGHGISERPLEPVCVTISVAVRVFTKEE